VLTGDVHANWANDILRDFDDPGSEVIGTEFVGTSITSGGDGSNVRADTPQTLAENPHIKFFNNQRGYVRCRVTPQEWRADYRVVPYVSQPGAPVFTRASFAVEADNPGLRQVGEGRMSARTRRSSEAESDRIRAQERAGR
jgi:alkaline phosphatase D